MYNGVGAVELAVALKPNDFCFTGFQEMPSPLINPSRLKARRGEKSVCWKILQSIMVMSGGSSSEHITKLEDGVLHRETTVGGHTVHNSRPELPVYHRKLANPTPLGLLAFGTGIFFISCVGVNARGITTSNMIISIMIFYGGCCQFRESYE